MRVNQTKEKLLKGEVSYGYALGLGSPVIAEILARTGIDHLLVDNQHGTWGPDSTVAALLAMEGGSATPMARVARNDFTMIGRLLDEGMMGIVVPMVHTAEQARAAAEAARFPLKGGGRSWGWARAALYGDDYPDWIDDQVFLAVQIESAQAVENAEAILATPGVDGCWVGPSDLALSMGIHPRDALTHEPHRRALERVIQACHNTGKIPGISAYGLENAVERAREGFRFITAAGDSGFLVEGARAGVRFLEEKG